MKQKLWVSEKLSELRQFLFHEAEVEWKFFFWWNQFFPEVFFCQIAGSAVSLNVLTWIAIRVLLPTATVHDPERKCSPERSYVNTWKNNLFYFVWIRPQLLMGMARTALIHLSLLVNRSSFRKIIFFLYLLKSFHYEWEWSYSSVVRDPS